MPDSPLALGDVVAVTFPEHRPGGREQQGYRPAVVVGLPQKLGRPRFPVVVVVPLTSDSGQAWAIRAPGLYIRLPAGSGGLRSPSIALLDQVRCVDAGRLVRWFGALPRTLRHDLTDRLCRMLSSPE